MATRNFIFKLYPTNKQADTLYSWIGKHRLLYNAALKERITAYKQEGRFISYNDQQNALPVIKKEKPELVLLGSHALQETLRKLDRAFQGFFRRLKEPSKKPGFPRFKGRERFNSFRYPDPAGWKIISQKGHNGRLKVSNLGHIKMRGMPRVPLAHGELRCLTVMRKGAKWYAVVTARLPKILLLREGISHNRADMGLDAGCAHLFTTHEGHKEDHPRFLKKGLVRLKAAQQDLSRKKKGSSNRRKARAKVVRLHEKIAAKRQDYLHKSALSLVRSHSFIAVEKLSLQGMTRKGKGRRKRGLNRSMMEASIGQFYTILKSKAEEAGTIFVRVAPRGTSQNCSRCGNKVEKTLADRVHDCPFCGLVLDRDHNAALNILFLGLARVGREPSEAWRDRKTGALPPLDSVKCETTTIPV